MSTSSIDVNMVNKNDMASKKKKIDSSRSKKKRSRTRKISIKTNALNFKLISNNDHMKHFFSVYVDDSLNVPSSFVLTATSFFAYSSLTRASSLESVETSGTG